jgi:tetratricopeptide (TPR) repeat protein
MVDNDDKLDRITAHFLATGDPGDSDEGVLADACNDAIRQKAQLSSSAAVLMAQKFVRQAGRHGKSLRSMAQRALGWSCLVAGKYRESELAYLAARQMLKRDPVLRSRIDRILIDVYMYLGDYRQSERCARRAMRSFSGLKARADLAKTEVNYANLLHRQDRHREARDLYRRASHYFASINSPVAVATCDYNLANTLVQLFDFETAEQRYESAGQCFSKNGFDLYANDCRNGAAWLEMLRGNYHQALQQLASCEEGYRKASQPRGVVLCQLDLAEAYLALNLFTDARRCAQGAEKGANKLGLGYESAKAAFFYGKASYAMGRVSVASKALKRAREGFADGTNEAFLAAVRLFQAQMRGRIDDRMAEFEKARAGFSGAQLPLWEAICDLQQAGGSQDHAAPLARLSRNPAVKTVPCLIAHRQTLLGDRAARVGHLGRAVRHWTNAADVLDAVRAKLPPVDLRSAFTRHRTDPYLKLISAELPRNASAAAAWTERYRTAGVWAPSNESFFDEPARRRAEKSLMLLADQVTVMAGQMGDSDGKRTGAAIQSSRLQSSLRRKVRHELGGLRRPGAGRVDRLDEIRAMMNKASQRKVIVQFHCDGDDLVGFVHRRGQTRYHRYADGLDQLKRLMGQWRFLLGRRLYDSASAAHRDTGEEARLLADLGNWLWSPLEIGAGEQHLLVLPEGQLSNLPWQAIKVDGTPLTMRHNLVLSPSLRHHVHATRQRTSSQRVELFVGRSDGLDHVEEEVNGLAARAGKSLCLHSPCTRKDVPSGSSARLWHYSGHASLRIDNPFYSSLDLTDGPLFAADFQLRRNRVNLVMLAGCRTGQQVSLPGEESTGLVRSLLEMGARNVIASHWAVADESAAAWSECFYNHYFNRLSVGNAARQATIDVREKYPSAYDWAAFSIFGAG